MGEVYLAEDARLHRNVAIKILPEIMAGDPERRERFEREARAVAARNHPNIVTIHSVEEAGGVPFLVMEHVDGTPLGEMIPRGGLPLDRLLRIAIAVADALAAAQQRGITHRDLKPGNILIGGDGRVKVLDFGLAKLREAEIAAAADDLTRMPTRALTGEGKIIGTVAYMSPEQAEGKPVDPRSDIFSYGIMLHEMATGDRPFKGDTNVSIISAILKDTPSAITDLNPALPSELARIVRRCLAKDPSRRYQTAADLRNELEDLKRDTDSGVSGVKQRPAVRAKRRLPAVAAAVGGLLLAGAAIAVVARFPRREPPAARDFTIDHFTRLTTAGTVSLAALSPDARYVVHVKDQATEPSLWVRQTATTSDVEIVPPQRVIYDGLAFSPDGNYVYYSAYKQPGGGLAVLNRIPVLGGAPTAVLEDLDSPITFSPDAQHFAFMRGLVEKGTTALMVANADGSGAHPLATLDPPERFQSETPAWSPDGKTILASATLRDTRIGILAVDAASGRTTPIGAHWGFLRNLQWMPDGRSFLVDGIDLSPRSPTPQIWRVSYPAGERTRITNDLNAYIGVSLSADGQSIATVQTERHARIQVASLHGASWTVLSKSDQRADGITGLSWMPDGRLVFTAAASGQPQLWIADGDGRNEREIATLPGPIANPKTSPDGNWIYFQSICSEGVCIFRVAPDGSGLTQLTHGGDEFGPIVSPDGRTIYLTQRRSGRPVPAKVSADGGNVTPIAQQFFGPLAVSPDGGRLAGTTWNAETRVPGVGLMAAGGGPVTIMSGVAGAGGFSLDGRSWIYSDSGGSPSHLVARPLAGGPAKPLDLPALDGIAFGGDIARDGRIAVSVGGQTSDVVVITAVAAPKR
jgi:Tol biopolymer transport system component